MKTCIRCGALKSLGEFYRNSGTTDGLASYCKPCSKEYGAAWRAKNKEWDRVRVRSYHEANRERELARDKAWRLANADRVKAYARENRERNLAAQKAWRLANADRLKEGATARRRVQVDTVSRSYVAQQLGIPTADVTPELQWIKREQIAIRRLARQLKEKANEAKSSNS